MTDDWHVYLVRCSDTTLYCGITKDLAQRVKKHNFEKTGAKYTRSRRPVLLVWSRRVENRSIASKIEYRIKKSSKSIKENIVECDLDLSDITGCDFIS